MGKWNNLSSGKCTFILWEKHILFSGKKALSSGKWYIILWENRILWKGLGYPLVSGTLSSGKWNIILWEMKVISSGKSTRGNWNTTVLVTIGAPDVDSGHHRLSSATCHKHQVCQLQSVTYRNYILLIFINILSGVKEMTWMTWTVLNMLDSAEERRPGIWGSCNLLKYNVQWLPGSFPGSWFTNLYSNCNSPPIHLFATPFPALVKRGIRYLG